MDINRNFPEDFVQGGEDSTYYSGAEPLSEVESQLLDNLIRTESFDYAVDLHNQGRFITGRTFGYFASHTTEFVEKLFPLANTLEGEFRKKYPSVEFYERALIGLYGKRQNFDGSLYKHFWKKGIDGILFEVTGDIGTTSQDAQEINAIVLGNLLVELINQFELMHTVR